MSKEVRSEYDVIIMGGGPAGSTLGALLAKRTNLRIALFEKESFPREHIGESFAHPIVPVLEESGALAKVLASDCWVKKFGGVFNWAETPMVGFFDHRSVMEDGVFRWSMHVNRAEFDHILLDHAADLGVEVFQETSVSKFESNADGCEVTLKDGQTVRAGYFVDASGRRNSIATKQKREWLSGYRNIAIWQHFLGGKTVQTLPGDWNIFREPDVSAIGCFAFKDGWCWYIPVPKTINGERKITHSIGIVTIPEVLKQEGLDFTDQKTFMRTVQQVPFLKDMIEDVVPVSDKMLTATNYSMISEKFADLDERWILIGDSSYFVDPLFSSGVAFAVNQAANAALLIEATFNSELNAQDKQDLWRDYDEGWHGMAETFALSIDQWYHALGKDNPDSIYWHHRGDGPDLDIQEHTFDVLLNTAVTPNLMQVITNAPAMGTGPLSRAVDKAGESGLDHDIALCLAPQVAVRQSVALDVPGFKAFVPAPPFSLDADAKANNAHYWKDPIAHGDVVPALSAKPAGAHRFYRLDQPDAPEVRGLDQEGAAELSEILQSGSATMNQLEEKLTLPQNQLLKRLVRAGIVTTRQPPTNPPSEPIPS
jgi:flavin-dependent dehydrogenase